MSPAASSDPSLSGDDAAVTEEPGASAVEELASAVGASAVEASAVEEPAVEGHPVVEPLAAIERPGAGGSGWTELEPERVFVGTGYFWSLVVGGVLALVAVIFIIQNSDAVQVKFLGLRGDVSLAGIVFLTALVAVAIDQLVSLFYRRRRRRVLTERAAAERAARCGDDPQPGRR